MGHLVSGHQRQGREGRFWKEGVGESPCPKTSLFLASSPYLFVPGKAVRARGLLKPPPAGIDAGTCNMCTAWLRTPASRSRKDGVLVRLCVPCPLACRHVCEHGLQPALTRPAGFLAAAELAALTGPVITGNYRAQS